MCAFVCERGEGERERVSSARGGGNSRYSEVQVLREVLYNSLNVYFATQSAFGKKRTFDLAKFSPAVYLPPPSALRQFPEAN